MNNTQIEDIIIENRNNKEPKKGRGILAILIFLIIVLAGLCAFYIYIKNAPVKQPVKQLFFSAISNADFEFFTDNELYTEILNKYVKNNSKTESNITFSTTLKQPEEIEDIDISKFSLSFNTLNNINSAESYSELGVTYSDNELLKLKAINKENQFAWFSDEIVNKYVGVNKENYETILEKANINTEDYKNISDFSNKFKYISKEEAKLDKKSNAQEYTNYVSNYLTEEKFSSQDNFVLEREDAENVNVTAYSLKLTNQEYNELVKSLLTKLKEDENLISSIVTGNEIKKVNTDFTIKATTNLEPVGTEETTGEENIETEEIEQANLNNNNTEDVQNTEEQITDEQNIENEIINEEEQVDSNQNEIATGNQVEAQNIITEQTLEESLNSIKNELDINQILTAILLNRKIDCSVQDIQNTIDSYLTNIKNEENGFELTAYVSENATEKIHITFPNLATLDIEFYTEQDNERTVSITYLIEEDGLKYGEDNAVIYSASDNTITENVPVVTEKQTNGFKLDFYKLKNAASTKIKATYNFIENKEINKKVTINLITDGTTSSKNFENDVTIIYSSNDGELKANIENEIKFGINASIDILNEENSIFLDTLPEEELIPTIESIREKIKTVYNQKKESLSFIDTNTQTSLIQPTVISRDEAKMVLINTISNQMGEAQSKGEEYTIHNIANLEIAGHQVDVSIENDIAKVNVDGYKFEIDSSFGLTDVE